MSARDYRNIIGGGALILIGGFATVHSITTLTFGTLSRMGPGFFPTTLGVILVVFGIIIVVPALFRGGELPSVDIRAFAVVSASILAFALLARPYGLVPAIFAVVIIASRVDNRLSPPMAMVLATGFALTVTLLFRFALGLELPIFGWPW